MSPLVIAGVWLGIVGYAILYAGVVKLGGGDCSLGQAFRGECSQGAGVGKASYQPGGSATQFASDRQSAIAGQQALISSQPITV